MNEQTHPLTPVTPVFGVPEGQDAFFLIEQARKNGVHFHVALNDVRLDFLAKWAGFLASDLKIIVFPAWNTVPYDRISPASSLVAQRVQALLELLALKKRTENCPVEKEFFPLLPPASKDETETEEREKHKISPAEDLEEDLNKGKTSSEEKGRKNDFVSEEKNENGLSFLEKSEKGGKNILAGKVLSLRSKRMDDDKNSPLFSETDLSGNAERKNITSQPDGEKEKTEETQRKAFARNPSSLKPVLILASLPAAAQRLPPASFFENAAFPIKKGEEISFAALKKFLNEYGYKNAEKVFQPGEYAFRGGLIDIYPPSGSYPVRIDLFGEEVENIRFFDPLSQRSLNQTDGLTLHAMTETLLSDKSVSLFRSQYRSLFGAVQARDTLYAAVSAGQRMEGMEHWLPLFYEKTAVLFDYLPEKTSVSLDYQFFDAFKEHTQQINEYYEAREQALKAPSELEMIYHPVPAEKMFLSREEFEKFLSEKKNKGQKAYELTPFVSSENGFDAGGRVGQTFVEEKINAAVNVYDALADFIKKTPQKVILTAYSRASAEKIQAGLLSRFPSVKIAETFEQAIKKSPSVVLFPLERGFTNSDFAFVSQGDLFGEKIRPLMKKKKGKENFIQDVSSLNIGDLVVHLSHGIGQYNGLKTLSAGGAAHECLELVYAEGSKLFIPIENIDVLSRYGSDSETTALDRLGSPAWEAKKAKLKKYIKDVAEKLMALAAERYLKKVPKIIPLQGAYDDFCARFPYVETPDQLKAILDVQEDLSLGRPMDRLVCGDVGFGKTEVALRACFTTVMNGGQAAVVVPTTLLARQHYENFKNRFEGFPVRVKMLSRLVSAKEAKQTKEELKKGTVDIVIGTHALLSKNIDFKNLSLLVVDEEQSFGVAHKERLKELKSGVHVLTLTATPIPRTLQMALTGVRDLSVIATPPVDRLAVKTYILPFDRVIVKEAILRERFRGGQVFYVCPRISDMAPLLQTLQDLIPDLKIAAAHGQMPASKLEKIMTDFVEKKYDLLLSTSIIESGIDIPSVNTLIIHRADRFGLGQLYQIRGRVGRSKLRAFCYLTLPQNMKLGPVAQRRLSVLQSLDTLGAGFNLASQDLDIRGAGNLLGEEQSGHIQEVGVELYQKMLEEAVAALKAGKKQEEIEEKFSPQIALDLPVLIPETYIGDLALKMELYHRIAALQTEEEAQKMRQEMEDRFGPLPEQVINLFKVVSLKILARQANVEKVDVGPKGAVLSFWKKSFPNPAGLISFIQDQLGTVKLNADYRLTVMRTWNKPQDRLNGITKLLKTLAELASI